MEYHMEKLINKAIICTVILGLVATVTLIWTDPQKVKISEEAFTEKAVISQKEERVGANITLKQAIHGTDGIKYRYIIKTDCPQWDFETRYMADEPITWVDETSAVEVLIYDTQIRFDGTVYASGQYYTVPLLGGISSETVSLEIWKQNLIKQAYQAYRSDNGAVFFTRFLGVTVTKLIPVFGITVIALIMFMGLTGVFKVKKTYINKKKDKEM